MKKNRILLIAAIIMGLLLASCSRAYQPTNIQKKKGSCGTCSRYW